MKRHLTALLLLFVPLAAVAQDGGILSFADTIIANEHYVKQKTTRKIGIFITDIYNLDPAAGSFSVEYRAWSYAPKGAGTSYIEFPHAQKTSFNGAQLIEYRDSVWGHVHVSSIYHFDWDMTEFPFDTQTLRVECENSIDRSFVELVGDIKNSGIAPNAMQSGFIITDTRFFNDVQHTTTNFGNPLMAEDEECDFSTYVAEIDIRRDNPWMLFIKIFSAVIVSFFIATITFFINPRHFDARLSLIIGALFAAVGSKFVVDSVVGLTTELTLVDRIYMLTYAMIFLLAILLLISHRIYQNVDDRGAHHIVHRHFDMAAFTSVNAIYIIIIASMVATA